VTLTRPGDVMNCIGFPGQLKFRLPSVVAAACRSALASVSDPAPLARFGGLLGTDQRDVTCGPAALLSATCPPGSVTGGPVLRFGTGAGITWSSVPGREGEETELQASRLLAVASGVYANERTTT
jgi:para-aminobenzoate synthetase component 1